MVTPAGPAGIPATEPGDETTRGPAATAARLATAIAAARARLAAAGSRRLRLAVAAGVLASGAAVAAIVATWPAAPPARPEAVAKARKARPPAPAASGASAASAISPAVASPSASVATSAADAALAEASVVAAPASSAALQAPAEAPIDRLQRRLAETLGPASLQADGGGIKLTARRSAGHEASPRPARAGEAKRASTRPAAAPAAVAAAAAWSYDGPAGPEAWGRLHPDFARCASGRRQSPIDLHDALPVELAPLRLDYRPTGFSVLDTGRTVQVDLAGGNVLEVMGRRYELRQLSFHRPSEVRIGGRQFEMDVHLLHRDAQGRAAVLAIALESGAPHPVVQSVWNHVPLEPGEPQPASTPLDPLLLVPAERGHFTYMGSLTTPPCEEGVLWLVMKQPMAVSAQQIAFFARLYPMNARPLQPLAGRRVKESG